MIIKFPVSLEAGKEGIVAINVDLSEVKRTEERARRSDENFSTAFRINPSSIVITRAADGTILDINDNCLELLGYELQEMKNHLAADFWASPEKRTEFQRLMRETGSADDFELVLVGKDGNHHTVIASARFIEFDGIPAVLSISHDVTARKQAEEALLDSRNDLAEAQRIAHIGSWTWDMETDEVTWSDEHWSILGLEPGEFSRIDPGFFDTFVHPDDLEGLLSVRRRMAETGLPYSADFRILRRDGEVRHVQSRSGNTVPGRDVFGTIQDVTDRVRTEEALRRSEENFSIAFRMNPSSIVISGVSDGRVLKVNDRFVERFDYDLEEAKGKAVKDFWSDSGDRKKFLRLMNEMGSVQDYEAVFVDKHGKRRIALLSGRFIEFDGIPAVLSISHDISARKQAEAALRDSRDDLAAAQRMAHVGSWAWDIDADEVTWSDEHWAIFGLEPGEVSRIDQAFFKLAA